MPAPHASTAPSAARTRLAPLALAVHIAAAVLLLGPAANAQAQSPAQAIGYDIPAGPLAESLNRFAQRSGVAIVMDAGQLQGLRSPGLQGSHGVEEGFALLLRGSGYAAVRTEVGYVLRTAPTPAAEEGEALLPAVKVRDAAQTATGHVDGYVARRSATGTKTDTPLIETPQSITVVTAERIEAMGAVNLKDVLAYTPGIGIAPYGADSRFDWVSIRGFDAYSPGFYLDGLPLRNSGNFAAWRTENYGAERIEILRGPASVLYGLGNPGGMVNVVSKLPTEDPLHELQFQLGSHDRRQAAADFAGPLNADGTWLYRITGLARDAELPAGGMRDDRYFLAPSLTWKPSGDTRFTLMSQFVRTRSGIYTRGVPAYGSLLPTAIGTRIPSRLFLSDPDYNRYDQDQQMLGYQFENRFNDTWTVRQNARYSHVELDFRQLVADGFVTRNADDALDPANYRYISFSPYVRREQMSSFVIDNQAQAGVRIGGWLHTVLVGLDYQRSRLDQVMIYGGSAALMDIYATGYSSAPLTLADPSVDSLGWLSQTGLYLQDQIKRDRWVFTLGGRYDSARSRTVDRLSDGAVTRIDDHAFSGRAGAVYLAPNGWAPYVSYSESFVPTDTVDPTDGKPFEPETGRQYEAGIRWQPPGRTATYSAAVFDLRRQNYISYDTNWVPHQTGEISVRGLELEATAGLAAGLNLTASYAYTPHAEVTASANPELVGTQPTAVPRHRGSLWSDYRFGNGVKLGAGLRYEGSSRGIDSAAPVQVPAYTLFDAMIGYDVGQWSLALNAQNLIDKTYLTTCSASTCYYGQQRTVLGTATYRW